MDNIAYPYNSHVFGVVLDDYDIITSYRNNNAYQIN